MPFPLAQLPKIPDFEDWLLAEIGRARAKIAEHARKYPSASRAELAQRLIDQKKGIASAAGAVAGLFGLAAIPADLALVSYLELSLSVEIGVLYGVNLKAASGKSELLDLLGMQNGNGTFFPLKRALPHLASRVSTSLVSRMGLRTLGRAIPVLAAPITAYVNAREIQRVGEAAIRSFGVFRQKPSSPPLEG